MADFDRPALPRNGCHNRDSLRRNVTVQTGWSEWFYDGFGAPHRTPVHVEIPDPMSKDCQYSRTTADERCDGCKWRQALDQ